MTPKVSVVMSVFCRNHSGLGCPNLLRRALDSIVSQTFTDFELVLIDDASVDGSQQVCVEYAKKDPRIRLFRMEPNSGCPARRYNDGMLLAKADLYCHMFDDDEWYPNALADLYEGIIVTHPECGMVYGMVGYVDVKTGWRTTIGSEWDLQKLTRERHFCILGAHSIVVRREAINAVGGADEHPLFRRMCDWDLWVRIGRKFPVARIDKLIGCGYQGQPDSIGETIPVNNEVWARVLAMQADPNRRVRLQGELMSGPRG